MDALQAVASATQIVMSMIGAVGALEQASTNLSEAPKRIRSLEDLVFDLENLISRIKQKHVHKLHNPQLDHQIQSLESLVIRLHPNIRKARNVVSKSKMKNLAKIVWASMAGDPLGKIVNSIRHELNWWLESQTWTENVEKVIDLTAETIPIHLKVSMEQGYPTSSKCLFVKDLLEQNSSRKVILIVGLSGMGKSCLARQVASDPPKKFVGGAVELGFGQWCSRAACNGSKGEYQKRLAKKICKFLVQIGFWKKIKDESSGDLEYLCCLLQEALYGKSILVLLDDVWEQDIVERFAKLYDNDCRYLVTTRNEAVYEIAEAEKIELNKSNIREISKAILSYHSLLTEDELPTVAESLLDHCGHHPLTVAVIGKALRKETGTEKWEKAITNLSTYALCAPGPISYVNEKDAKDTVTIFGSFEFSLEAMPGNSRKFFLTLSALSWDEPVPEACLEAIWTVLGEENLFPIIVSKLVEGSLLMKSDLYHVHDMISLYLDSKIKGAVSTLLTEPSPEEISFISPWLFIFGRETVRKIAEQRIENILTVLEEKQAVIALESLTHALLASKSISELEDGMERFSNILGHRITSLISADSEPLIAVSAKAIVNVFSRNNYSQYFPSLGSIDIIDKLAVILENSADPMIQSNMSIVLAKLAEFGNPETVDEVLHRFPFGQLATLLSPSSEIGHEGAFATLVSLIKAGNSKAVEKMFAYGIEKNIMKLLESGSEVAQHHAIVTLKTFYELGGPSPRPGTLKPLPWHVRLSLERFVLSDQNNVLSLKPQTYEDIMHNILKGDNKQIKEAMQDLIPVIERAGEPRTLEMIVQSPLIKRLSDLLQYEQSVQNSIKSESAFLLMKLICSGGKPCIKKILEFDVIPNLVKMMQCNIPELQDAAYTTIHQLLFSNTEALVLNQFIHLGLIDKLVHSMESRYRKTKELNLLCVLDIVEMGNKDCIEQLFSLQLVEKLVKIEKASEGSGETLIKLLKGMDKCKNLTSAERKVMKHQVIRKVRAALRGHKFEIQILAALDACAAEGSRGSSSSGSGSVRHRK